jgi:hypothetical protein
VGIWREASLSDLLLLRTAIREGWQTPLERRASIMEEALSPLSAEDTTPRKGNALCRLLLDAEQHNLKLQHGKARQAGRKFTVEECQCVDATQWANLPWSGTRRWTDRSGAISYSFDEVLRDSESMVFRLEYERQSPKHQQPDSGAYDICLSARQTRFGGLRWLFICPLVVSDIRCHRHVSKLYLPPWGTYFGCRHCYQLTYASRQASRSADPKESNS